MRTIQDGGKFVVSSVIQSPQKMRNRSYFTFATIRNIIAFNLTNLVIISFHTVLLEIVSHNLRITVLEFSHFTISIRYSEFANA